jgi:hypothetical protein
MPGRRDPASPPAGGLGPGAVQGFKEAVAKPGANAVPVEFWARLHCGAAAFGLEG